VETGQRFSPIADSFASRLKWIGGRAPREPVTLGIILLVFGVVAFGISPWFAWFTVASALLLLTWNTRMQGAWRGLLYFFALLPVLHWFNSMSEFLFHEDAVTGLLFMRDRASLLEIGSGLILAVAAGIGLVAVIRHRPLAGGVPITTAKSGPRQLGPVHWSNVPVATFADVGGMDAEKRRIAAVVNNRLHPEKFQRHGVTQNGILLYGPRGTGKTFLAEATAGEFRINYYHVQPTALVGGHIGSSEANIRAAFQQAHQFRPVLFFIDELDSIGTQRQQLGRHDDTGGGARAYNAIVTELMQCVDRYRSEPGFILMAATNFYDGLDEALVRDLRFDEKIRVDLPGESAREQILTVQLSKRLWTPFPVKAFAARTPGWSAAKLSGLVNKAASSAALENRHIEQQDLQRAFDDTGGADRPLIKPVDWDDLVLSPPVERDLRNLIRLMNPGEAERLKVPVPTGLLLVGPPGYGKTSIAHLLATQTRRSFYPITPADVPTPEKLVQAFSRARENSPSILFIDEIDGLLPRGDNRYYKGQHQIQLVEQALILMSQLDPANQVFLVGTTNHIDDIDPRVLRGGRFTEKIEVCPPDDNGYLRLIEKYLGPIPLAADFGSNDLLARLRGISPADLLALVNTAKRMAMNRMAESAEALPPLVWDDFEKALQRNQVSL
jgi:transitional endoplasmic reticulum ATPase